jgi:hypothetical protein
MTKDPSKKCHQHRSEIPLENTENLENSQELIPPSEPRIIYESDVININDDDDEHERFETTTTSVSVPIRSVPSIDLTAEVPIFELVGSQSKQCEGKTRSGNQCARMTLSPSKRCHFHQHEPVDTRADRTPSSVQSLNDSVDTIQEFIRQLESLARNRLQELTTTSSSSQLTTMTSSTLKDPRPKRNKEQKKEQKEVSKKNKKDPSGKTEECCVCYDPVPEDEFLECDHAVCKSCIGQLRDTRCPMCRAEIKSKNISESQKKKMVRRRIEDQTNRNNQLVQQYMELVNQTENPAYSSFRLDF